MRAQIYSVHVPNSWERARRCIFSLLLFITQLRWSPCSRVYQVKSGRRHIHSHTSTGSPQSSFGITLDRLRRAYVPIWCSHKTQVSAHPSFTEGKMTLITINKDGFCGENNQKGRRRDTVCVWHLNVNPFWAGPGGREITAPHAHRRELIQKPHINNHRPHDEQQQRLWCLRKTKSQCQTRKTQTLFLFSTFQS